MQNKRLPEVNGKTIMERQINKDYFKNKVTLINFMYIGCPPCMKEIKVLNEVNSILKSENFQILCISPHVKEQLISFNADDTTAYSKLRKILNVEKINYEILPECTVRKKQEIKDSNIYIYPECNTISKQFNVESYPLSFLIDKKGIIRKIYKGFPADEELVLEYKNEMISDIQSTLLK